YSSKSLMKIGRPKLRSIWLLDQLRERIGYCHYSLRTEQAYVFWVRRFIRFHELRHPREMGAPEVEAFLTHLATARSVAPSTHKQALAAVLFLYRQVLDIDLPWLQEIARPKGPTRIPVVLSREEVARLLSNIDEGFSTIATLLYGAGLPPYPLIRDAGYAEDIISMSRQSGAPLPAL